MEVSAAVNYFCTCIVLSLLHLQSGEAQSVIPRVERLNSYAVDDTNPLPGSTFFVPLGQRVKFYCICQAYAMVQILHNDSIVHPWHSCSTILHTVHNVSYSDEGRYTCRVLDASNHICDRSLGNLSVISSDVVLAEPRQHGILHTRTSLRCSSMLDVFQDMIIYKWFRGCGESKIPLEEWPEFVSTNHSHQGLYTCQVYISSLDIRIEKIVEFLVTDPPLTLTETTPTFRTPPTIKTAPPSGTPPTSSVNSINQSASSAMTGILNLLPVFLLLVIAMLLGT